MSERIIALNAQLYAAIKQPNPDPNLKQIVANLLDQGAETGFSIMTPMGGASFPLLLAADLGRTDVVELLLDRGADIHQHNDRYNALFVASIKGHADTVAVLIKRDERFDFPEESKSHEALSTAISYGNDRVVELLLEHGVDANTDYNGISALHLAINLRRTNAVKALLENGAKTTTLTEDYETPLVFAAAIGDTVDIIKLLVEYGADVNAETNDLTALLSAVKAVNNVDVLQQLIDAGADVNRKAPMVAAIKRGHTHYIEQLLKAGADVNQRDGFGVSPLMALAFRGKATISNTTYGKVAAAITNGYCEEVNLREQQLVHTFIERGAQPYVHDSLGNSSLYYAAQSDNHLFMEYLLELGDPALMEQIKLTLERLIDIGITEKNQTIAMMEHALLTSAATTEYPQTPPQKLASRHRL